MQKRFIVAHNNQEQGPFDEAEVFERLRAGELLPIDYYYDEDLKDWVMIQDRFNPSSSEPLATPPAAPPDILSTVDAPPPQNVVFRKNQPVVKPLAVVPASALPVTVPVAPKVVVPQTSLEITASHTAIPIPKPEQQSKAHVQFHGGVGTVSLKQLEAGRVMLRLHDPSSSLIQPARETVIDIQAGPARSITWQCPSEAKAGEDVTVVLHARDAYDNPATKFNESIELVVGGQKPTRFKVAFVDGHCSMNISWTIAEIVKLELVAPDRLSLALPPVAEMKVSPGKAHQLIIESQTHAIAGESVAVTVKAVDRFGNLATEFTGDLDLEVINQRSKAG